MTTVDRRTPHHEVAPGTERVARPPVAVLGLVAVGGAVGAVARTALSLHWPPAAGGFPWSTLLENTTGAFALGWLLAVLPYRRRYGWAGPLLATGFLGGYTTFATMGLELHALGGLGAVGLAATYLLASAVLGLLAVAAGIGLGRRTAALRVRP